MDKATPDGSIHIVASKGMYGLTQSGLLANELLEKRLNKGGYQQSKLVPGLWTHKWRLIQFTSVVGNFVIAFESILQVDSMFLTHVLDAKIIND